MKKTILLAVLAFSAISTNAQLTVYPNGRVGIATDEDKTPISPFAIRQGTNGFEAAVSGSARGLYAKSLGSYLGWSYGLYGQSSPSSTNFLGGVYGIALLPSPTNSHRAFGVIGVAGNATNGWNYGVYGQLNGPNKGAGIYGTATNNENGTEVDGRYAGYFSGATKVKGDLTVTGSIHGVVLGTPASATPSLAHVAAQREEPADFTTRLSSLKPSAFYMSVPTPMKAAAGGDTVAHVAPLSSIETQIVERVHYGIEEDQMAAAFPELVYKHENGSSSINYMELIPVLVQTINELNARIRVLEGTPATRRSKALSTAEAVSTDNEMQCQLQVVNKSSETATIAYSIPTDVQQAEVCVCDMSGQLKKSKKVSGMGQGEISLSTKGCAPGIYLFSLIVDGKVYSTQRVMLNN